MKKDVWISVLLCVFGLTANLKSQERIDLMNPSFEDMPRKGGTFSAPIRSWLDCGASLFPGESPPDIHPVPEGAWEVFMPPAHCKTYLGLVVRFNDTYESISQRLDEPLSKGKCYSFSAFLARSPQYMSATSRSRTVLENFTKHAVFRVWGGFSPCDKEQLLAESTPVENADWQQHDLAFKANESYSYIILEAFYDIPILEAYNGHVLVDGLSSIVEMECK